MQISFFNSLPAKGQPHKHDEIITIDKFINSVKFGSWKEQVDKIRKEQDKDVRTRLKRSLPSVTISGVFGERSEANLVKHSGFICIDVDDYTDKSRILSDKYTYACFDSASGKGFAVIVKIDPTKHKDSFRWLQKYYFDSFGIIVDPAPSNPASLRYVTYDKDVEINQKSHKSKSLVEQRKKPKSLPVVVGNDKASEYVKEAQTRGLDIAPTYQDYLNLSFALVDGFGEGGRDFFHALCSNSEKYDSRHANRQYDIAIKRGKSGISVGTFYFMLKQAGIEVKSDSYQSLSIVAMGKKSGRKKEAIVEQLVTVNNVSKESAEQLVDEVFKRDDMNLKSLNADPEQLISSIIEWLALNHPLKENEITKAYEDNYQEIKEKDLNSIYIRCRSFFNTNEVTFDLVRRIIFSRNTSTYNPITEYIEKNLHRNAKGLIDKIISTIETDTPGAEVFIRKWLLSIIAAYRWNPVRSVLALVGGQLTGKTEWFRRLLPEPLLRYYAESKLDAGKDDDLLMCQKLIVMDDEMGGKSKDDEKRFKELTSKSVFSLRAPYGKSNEDFKRLALLCGTSNPTDIISDRTGNTRILPIHVISINHALYNSIDKDELFMELYHAYESGEVWMLSKSELNLLAETSKDFENINYELELLSTFFKPKSEGGLVEFLTATSIKDYIEKSSRQQIKNMKAFGIELKKYFGESKKNGSKGRFYEVVKIMDANNSTFTPPEPPKTAPENKINEDLETNSLDFDEDLPF